MKPYEILEGWMGAMVTVVIAGQSLGGKLIGYDELMLVLNDSTGSDILCTRSVIDFMFLGEGVEA